MAAWTGEDLRHIAGAQELEIAPVRHNGQLHRPTPVWVVRARDELNVRAAYVDGSAWHHVARSSGQTHIKGGDVGRT
jgi:hypothetical protein